LNSDNAAIAKCEEIMKSLKEGEDYYDPDFGPKNDDDNEGNRMSLYYNGNPPVPGYPKPDEVSWLKPEVFCQGEVPKFIDKDASANDVKQGDIGNCWFVGALSVLASYDELIGGESTI
jgi:calpain